MDGRLRLVHGPVQRRRCKDVARGAIGAALSLACMCCARACRSHRRHATAQRRLRARCGRGLRRMLQDLCDTQRG